MKAREIKKEMLDDYKNAIEAYNIARVRLGAVHEKIRQLEFNLKRYFNINVTHNFE